MTTCSNQYLNFFFFILSIVIGKIIFFNLLHSFICYNFHRGPWCRFVLKYPCLVKWLSVLFYTIVSRYTFVGVILYVLFTATGVVKAKLKLVVLLCY